MSCALSDALPDFVGEIGTTNLLADESSAVPVTITSGLELSTVSFALDLPVRGLENLRLQAYAPEVQSATLQSTPSSRFLVRLE